VAGGQGVRVLGAQDPLADGRQRGELAAGSGGVSGALTRPWNRRRISAAVSAIGPPWRAWCRGSAAVAGAAVAAAQAIRKPGQAWQR
jgi:hypothetical protein